MLWIIPNGCGFLRRRNYDFAAGRIDRLVAGNLREVIFSLLNVTTGSKHACCSERYFEQVFDKSQGLSDSRTRSAGWKRHSSPTSGAYPCQPHGPPSPSLIEPVSSNRSGPLPDGNRAANRTATFAVQTNAIKQLKQRQMLPLQSRVCFVLKVVGAAQAPTFQREINHEKKRHYARGRRCRRTRWSPVPCTRR
jgi:hypothetical protein